MKRPMFLLLISAAGLLAVGAAVGRHGATTLPVVRVPDTPQPGGVTLLPNGWRVTPAGRAIPLPGDLPLGMALTPDGRSLLVSTAGFHDHSVSVIDLAGEKLSQSVNVGRDWNGLSVDAGANVYVSGGGTLSAKFLSQAATHPEFKNRLEALTVPVIRLAYNAGRLTPQDGLDVPGLTGDRRYVAGLAAGPDGSLYVANLGSDTVYKLGGVPKTVQASVPVGRRPYAVTLSPDGQTLAVANWADASVSLLDPGPLTERARVPVGRRPNALAWGKDGRLFVADSGDNAVSVIAGATLRETIKTSLDPRAPVGSTPDALVVSPDGRRLYVANADNNDVAVVDISRAQESRVLGFIPTGWYPSALAVSPDGRRLFIGTGKGLRFRPNATPGTRITSPNSVDGFDYIGNCLSGTVSVVDVPSAAHLAAYTRQVRANVPTPASPAVPQAVAETTFRKTKHVVYIIRENRTYDEDFGDIKQGNGDPSLCLFNRDVTPNAHTLADRYVLLDNLYCNGEVSEDGHQWCDAAYATDYTERAWPLSYGGRGEPDEDDGLGASPAGYLWDNCARHGVSYRNYGEASSFKSSPDSPPVFTGPKTLNGHTSYAYAQIPWFGKGRDLARAQVFIDDLHQAEHTGAWPQLMVLSLPEDHTQGLEAGAYTPTANVAENDQALGRIVEAVSHSKFWPQTAIFVIEDDAQNGPDHVDAHRTVGLVLSPYVRHGVDSTLYTTASFVRTMELILGLPPMTQFDADATPLYASFTGVPDLMAYDCRSPHVDLEARNPKTGPGAQASAKLDLSAPDRADPDALNAILWHALRPGRPLPAPVRSALLPR